VERCTNCNARLLPGDVSCRSCGFDLISGRMPGEKSSQEQKRTMVLAAGAVASLLLIFAGAFAVGNLGKEPPPASVPCLEALALIQPAVVAKGGGDHSCDKTPPGPTDCWSLAGVPTSMLPRRDDMWLKLQPSATGFQITCRSDEDGDGDWALFQATQDVVGLRISRPEVR
jgi:hypothetical protein